MSDESANQSLTTIEESTENLSLDEAKGIARRKLRTLREAISSQRYAVAQDIAKNVECICYERKGTHHYADDELSEEEGGCNRDDPAEPEAGGDTHSTATATAVGVVIVAVALTVIGCGLYSAARVLSVRHDRRGVLQAFANRLERCKAQTSQSRVKESTLRAVTHRRRRRSTGLRHFQPLLRVASV